MLPVGNFIEVRKSINDAIMTSSIKMHSYDLSIKQATELLDLTIELQSLIYAQTSEEELNK